MFINSFPVKRYEKNNMNLWRSGESEKWPDAPTVLAVTFDWR